LGGGSFKPVPGGFVVAAPRLWPFASAQHYVVPEARQAEIEARLTNVDRAYGSIAFVLVAIAFIVADEIGVTKTSGFLGLYTLAIAVLGASSRLAAWLAVRPILTALPLTSERITFAERARMTAASTPLWRLLASDVFLVSLGLWMAPIGFNGLTHHFATHWTAVASAWLWTVAAVGVAGYHIYLTVLKLT